jgi:hypothetical protein
MQQERRNHPRFTVDGIKAHLTIKRPANDTLEFEGEVIDLSYTGIKIHLDSPLPEESEGWVSIVLILPNSQIPVAIRGEIKHLCQGTHYGVQCDDTLPKDAYDELLFECVKSGQKV